MRYIKAIGALIALLAVIVAPPVLLIRFIGNPWPTGGIDLGTPLTDDAIIGLLAVVLWVLWAQVLVCVIAEAVAAVRSSDVDVRIPGVLGIQQHLARTLITSIVIALVSVPTLMRPIAASAAPVEAAPTATTAASVQTPQTVVEQTPTVQKAETHAITVQRGDTLWSIAERHLGDGERWTDIANLNEGHTMGGNQVFRSSDLIRPGWTLQLPGKGDEAGADVEVIVKSGDTLSQIALDKTGHANDYPEIVEASRDIVQPGGQHLSDPNVILPGWTVRVPGAHTDAPATDKTPSKAPAEVAPGPQTPEQAPAAQEPVQEAPAVPEAAPGAASQAAPEQKAPAASSDHTEASDDASDGWPVRTIGGIGGLLAAALVGLLIARRRRQQQKREPGQTVPLPTEEARAVEVELRSVADLDLPTSLDRTLRLLAVEYAASGTPLPKVQATRVVGSRAELYLVESATLPAPWVDIAGGTAWARDLDTTDSTVNMPAPYPTLVTVGHDNEDGHILLNLEQLGSLGVTGPSDQARPLLAAMVLELASSRWGDDAMVTVCGAWSELEELLPADRLRYVPSLGSWAALGDRAEVLVLAQPATEAHEQQMLNDAIAAGVAVLTTGEALGTWTVDVTEDAGTIQPLGLPIQPQQVSSEDYLQLVEILGTSLLDPTPRSQPRPNLSTVPLVDQEHTVAEEPEPVDQEPVDEISPATNDSGPHDGGEASTPAGETLAAPTAPYGGTITIERPTETRTETQTDAVVDVAEEPATKGLLETGHPVLRILGPTVDILGADDAPASESHRGVCTRMAAFLVLNRGATKVQLVDAVWGGQRVSANTVDSRVSHLRAWLGRNPETDKPYLPPRSLTLDASIKTDWDIYTETIGQDAQSATTDDLVQALTLVRGRPLEGENPRHYAFAEFTAQEMISGVVDATYELARRRYMDGRWRDVEEAAALAVKFEPGMERLWRIWIHAAHAAGNPPAVAEALDRMHARIAELGFDLEPETLELIAALQDHDADTIAQARGAL